jgi:hypothetical protein
MLALEFLLAKVALLSWTPSFLAITLKLEKQVV